MSKMGVHNLLMHCILKISAAQLARTHCEPVMGVLAFSMKNKAQVKHRILHNYPTNQILTLNLVETWPNQGLF